MNSVLRNMVKKTNNSKPIMLDQSVLSEFLKEMKNSLNPVDYLRLENPVISESFDKDNDIYSYVLGFKIKLEMNSLDENMNECFKPFDVVKKINFGLQSGYKLSKQEIEDEVTCYIDEYIKDPEIRTYSIEDGIELKLKEGVTI